MLPGSVELLCPLVKSLVSPVPSGALVPAALLPIFLHSASILCSEPHRSAVFGCVLNSESEFSVPFRNERHVATPFQAFHVTGQI